MKKPFYYPVILAFIFVFLSFPQDIKSNIHNDEAVVNLAMLKTVKASTSYVSPHERLEAVNDGKVANGSYNRDYIIYGNWNGEGEYGKYNWVQYEWPYAHQISSIEVYWFRDQYGLQEPTHAYVEYWNGLGWSELGDIGNELDKFNLLSTNIFSKKIRLTMKSETSTGISEFRITGVETQECEPAEVTSYVRINGGEKIPQAYAQALIGESVSFHPKINNEGGLYLWNGPNGFSSTEKEVQLTNLQANQSGTYEFCYINQCGAESISYFILTVKNSEDGASYEWPEYNPTIHYNFKENYPEFEMPVKNLTNDCRGEAWRIDDDWWTFIAGPRANSLVTEAAVKPLLKRLNDDFRYIRDVMGWPPDKRVMEGYRSAVYLFGSGLSTDNASNTEKGGWQSATTTPDGQVWPMILISYYPVYCFDPSCTWGDREYNKGGVVHEGIHAIQASLPGCKDAAWFHECSNTWLQATMENERAGLNNNFGFDWLSMGSFLAPFMPIECYSGWLLDDTFGGPAAQGEYVQNNNGEKLCNVRNLLGGVQYSQAFAAFLYEIIGHGSVPWVWVNCPGHVLEGISKELGHEQTQRLIREYRARIALADMGRYSKGVLDMYNNNWGVKVGSEWKPWVREVEPWYATPYAKTTVDENGYLVPEYRTTPGWSGANIIPIHTKGDKVTVNFTPLSKNMSCQLCYRTKSGEAVYGEVVFAGDCTLAIPSDKQPANGVVFVVICNMDYIYEGEITRTTHHDYRLKLGEGATRTATINKKWYDWKSSISDPTGIADFELAQIDMVIYPNPAEVNSNIAVKFNNLTNETVVIEVVNLNGSVVYSQESSVSPISIPSGSLNKGFYIVSLRSSSTKISKKIIVN